MANQEHLGILKADLEGWNEWRKSNPSIKPDLSNADLAGSELFIKSRDPEIGLITREFTLFGLDFRGTDFSGADLRGAHIDSASFSGAKLSGADLARAFVTYNYFSDRT